MHDNSKRFTQLIEGSLLGFAVADALGVPVEFTSREERRRDPVGEMRSGGAHGQPAGTWSDDTSMTLCLIHSLIENGIDYENQMRRFADWVGNGAYTAWGNVFDVGGTTYRAIRNHLEGAPALVCGETSEHACGNGSLMRIMPMAFYLKGRSGICALDNQAADVIHKASDCTHAHRRCEMACGIYCDVIFHMCGGGDLHEAVMAGLDDALRYYHSAPGFEDLLPEFESLRTIASWDEAEIHSGGFVLHTLQATLWCLLTTSSYAECALKAVNLGSDTDTTAAVAGALAGMWYGAEAIPAEWLAVLAKAEEMKELAERFAEKCMEVDK